MSADLGSTQEIRASYTESFAPGALIFDEGDSGRSVYVIQSGEVELTRLGAGGRSIVARLGPGEFFGEMSAILGEERTARARAVGPTELFELDSETLEGMCIERPEILIRVLQRVTHRLIDAERRLSALGLDDWLRPMVRAVVDLAGRTEGPGVVPGTLRSIADSAGLTMHEAHRALHELIDRKLVRIDEDQLVTDDVAAVAACLEPGRGGSLGGAPSASSGSSASGTRP